ncbi:MAG: helix-turn-helix domain-containing protein [Streptomyces sp.]|uniref:helix-turn-helix domain-containing protein n=1 Tax=Streptomyces sp. TaxID=1931 RepID=UPI003D6A89FD
MAKPVRARRLTDEEGRRLLRIVRRGRHNTVKVRHAMMVLASASGNTNEAIARLVAADPDTVRDVIHAFNERGLECLDPRWAGGAPRRITAGVHRPGGHRPTEDAGPAVHPLEPAQAGRLPLPPARGGPPGAAFPTSTGSRHATVLQSSQE